MAQGYVIQDVLTSVWRSADSTIKYITCELLERDAKKVGWDGVTPLEFKTRDYLLPHEDGDIPLTQVYSIFEVNE